MSRAKGNKKLLIGDELATLIKQKRCRKRVEAIIKNHPAEDLIDSRGRRPLHLAAQYNNIKLINFLIKCGYDLDIEDSSGMTPVMTAVAHDHLEATSILYSANCDKLFDGNSSDLEGEMEAFMTYCRNSVNAFVSKMKEKGIGTERIGELLALVNCPLRFVVTFEDPAVTKAYLHTEYWFNKSYFIEIPDDMFKFNVDHVKVLVQSGTACGYRRELLAGVLMKNILNYQKSEKGRDFLKKLLQWNVLKKSMLKFLEKELKKAKRIDIKIFLQYGFHTVAKAECGQDILAGLYANSNPKVITLLKNEEIDVNRRYYLDNTPLHYAAENQVRKNIQLLLEKGADPNVLNKRKESPLYLALQSDDVRHSEGCVKLLLLAGANPLIIDYYQFTEIIYGQYHKISMRNVHIAKLLSAQFAIYEALGLSIEQTMESFMKFSNQRIQSFFEECRQQLKELKMHKIREIRNRQLTLFEIVAKKPENIAQYIREEDVKEVTTYVKNNRKKMNSYYRELLKKHIKDIVKMNSNRSKAIAITCKYTGINLQHLVMKKIFSFLNAKDLLKFE